jgi:hypothetical protein
MNFPNLTAGQVSIKAIAMGGMATLFTCLVLYPPRHTELADSHALIVRCDQGYCSAYDPGQSLPA